MLTRLILGMLILFSPWVVSSPGVGPWGPYNFNTKVTGETYLPECDIVSSGVDDNLDGRLTDDEIIVTVVICGNEPPIVRTKGK
jgi:hypothetical protein